MWMLVRVIARWMVVPVLVVWAASCVPKEGPAPEALSVPVIEIDGQTIYSEEFENFCEMDEFEQDRPELERRAAIDSFIIQKVLRMEAEKEGFTVEPERVEDIADEWFPRDEEADPLVLEQIAGYLVVQEFLRARLAANEKVDLNEMRDYYVRHSDEFVVEERFLVLEILVADREFADQLAEQLQPGDFRNFREMAKNYSIGSTAAQGGELGVFSRGELPEKFEEVISRLRVGEISPVFRSEAGYHIFVVEQKTPKHAQRFYEVQQQVFDRLVAEKERQALLEFLPEVFEKREIYVYENGIRKRWKASEIL